MTPDILTLSDLCVHGLHMMSDKAAIVTFLCLSWWGVVWCFPYMGNEFLIIIGRNSV